MTVNEIDNEIFAILPYRLGCAVRNSAAILKAPINEIRLRAGQVLCLTSNGKNYRTSFRVTADHIDEVVRTLCANSLYSHAETIREGYITTPSGIRAGVAGRAISENGNITAVSDITTVCIRIPRRIVGAADEAFELLKKQNFNCGMLVYSPPGVGKTTLLRELIYKLSTDSGNKRVTVVDSRCELDCHDNEMTADILKAYPRSKGIEIGVRTLGAEYIICDEIGCFEDTKAVLEACRSGVHIIATAHSSSIDELIRSVHISPLIEADAFGIYLGLLGRWDNTCNYITEVNYASAVSKSDIRSKITL